MSLRATYLMYVRCFSLMLWSPSLHLRFSENKMFNSLFHPTIMILFQYCFPYNGSLCDFTQMLLVAKGKMKIAIIPQIYKVQVIFAHIY